MNISKLRKLVKLKNNEYEAFKACNDEDQKLLLRLEYLAGCAKVAAAMMQMTKSLTKTGTREGLSGASLDFIRSTAQLSACEMQLLFDLMPHIVKLVEAASRMTRERPASFSSAPRFQQMSMKTVDTFIDKLTELIQAGWIDDAVGLAEELRRFIHNH